MNPEIKSSTEFAFDIADKCLNDINSFLQPNLNRQTLKAILAPSISNAVFVRQKEIVEKERLDTLIVLSKNIESFDEIYKLFNALGYKLEKLF